MEITKEAVRCAIINIKKVMEILDKADNDNIMLGQEITKAQLSMDAIQFDVNIAAEQLGIEERA